MDGAVYEWNVQECKREGESVLKSCGYTSLALTPDLRTTFAVGSDCTLKEIILAESNVRKGGREGGRKKKGGRGREGGRKERRKEGEGERGERRKKGGRDHAITTSSDPHTYTYLFIDSSCGECR